MLPLTNKFSSPIDMTRRQFVGAAAGGIAGVVAGQGLVHSAQLPGSLPVKAGRMLL